MFKKNGLLDTVSRTVDKETHKLVGKGGPIDTFTRNLDKDTQKMVKDEQIKAAAETEKDKFCIEIAAIWGIPYKDGKFYAGCPGIMNPLKVEPIKIGWGAPNGGYSYDKVERFNQFYKALVAIKDYGVSSPDFYDSYSALNIHGRVMFLSIPAVTQPAIAPYATKGLDLNEVPYGKGGCTVQQIFDHHCKNIAPYLPSVVEPVVTPVPVPEVAVVDTKALKTADAATQTEDQSSTKVLTIADVKDDLEIAVNFNSLELQDYLNECVTGDAEKSLITKTVEQITKLANLAIKLRDKSSLEKFLTKIPQEYLELVKQKVEDYKNTISTGEAPPPYYYSGPDPSNEAGWVPVEGEKEKDDTAIIGGNPYEDGTYTGDLC